MNKHTQDVEEIFEQHIIDEHPYGTEYDRPKLIKALNKAYLSQVLEVIGEDEPLREWGNLSIEIRNKIRQELRTKFIKLWGKE